MINAIQEFILSIEKFTTLAYCRLTNAEAVFIYRVYYDEYGTFKLYDPPRMNQAKVARINPPLECLIVRFFRIYYIGKWFTWEYLYLDPDTELVYGKLEHSTLRWSYIDKSKRLIQQLQQETI